LDRRAEGWSPDRARGFVRRDDEFDSPAEEYAKEQEVIRREFAMGLDDPDRQAGLLLFGPRISAIPIGSR